MKRYLVPIIILASMLLNSCKKAEYCLYCNQDCFYCQKSAQNFCSVSFVSNLAFKSYIDSLVKKGDTCIFKTTRPVQSISYQYCGNNGKAEEIQKTYESQNYKCEIFYLTH